MVRVFAIPVVVCALLTMTTDCAGQSASVQSSPSSGTTSPSFNPPDCWAWLYFAQTWDKVDPKQGKEINSERLVLPYLRGLQYGYEFALRDFVYDLESHGAKNVLDSSWSKLLVPPPGKSWEAIASRIDEVCRAAPELRVVNSATQAVRESWGDKYQSPGATQDDRLARMCGTTCRNVQAEQHPWFIRGALEGQDFLWAAAEDWLARVEDKLQGEKQSLVAVSELARNAKLVRKGTSETPHPDASFRDVYGFCSSIVNRDVPIGFAIRAAMLQSRGAPDEDVEPLVEPFRCASLRPFWRNGTEFRGSRCVDVTGISNGVPLLNKPLGYMVGIRNESEFAIEIDWSDWSLLWKDRGGNTRLNAALDPNKVQKSLERRANVAAALAAFGAALSAGRPQTVYVYGSQGMAAVVIYPPATEVSNAAAVAAERASMEPQLTADALAAYSLKRTTVPPGGQITGMVLFEKPKGSSGQLELRLKGRPTLRIPLTD